MTLPISKNFPTWDFLDFDDWNTNTLYVCDLIEQRYWTYLRLDKIRP